ncbi:PAS domain S-box [Methanolobus tindarius DSM 2278]|uniref:PAS domain S-box n=1 Tax=Methanolobus tindarius DSM 2278 TaxID=1090322 RepID=W9DV59_METTI|nr:PAS domain S-box protein [Methanolobus tindarius]ETA67316.1 PAS domain S-box [Methanolobus tindarius DSM 2278]
MTYPDKPRVLVVDDEPMNVELLQAYLSEDYEVLSAYNGHEALEIIFNDLPDIVLLDVMMPDINGYQVCERIKNSETTQFIPVVLVTALSGREDRLKGIESKADDFLTKPVDRLELKMRVRSLLRIKKLHDNVIQERDQAQNYLDVAAVMMLALDCSQNITLINKRGLEILGCEESEVIGKNLLEQFIPVSARSEMEIHFLNSLNTSGIDSIYYECPIITKNNDERMVNWYSKPLIDESGKVTGVLFSGQDITIRKKAEEKLREQTHAMEASIDGMAIIDEEGIHSYVNASHAHIFGYDNPRELIGKKWDMLYNPSEVGLFKSTILPDFRKKGKWQGELIGRRKDGSTFYQEISLTALDKGLISVVRDISKRKEFESQLNDYAARLKTSNELKDLFTDILRHDLLNPAGVVKGFTDMLLNEENDENKIHKLQLIDSNVTRLIEMIESAAKFAKLEDTEKLEFKSMDIGSILKNVSEELKPQLEAKDITLDMKVSGHYPAVINPLIDGVFTNFISNAIKYGPSESVVTVDVQDLGDEWKVVVSDKGEGIPDKDKVLIFNRFQRLAEKKKAVKGSGLGLAIAKRIVELHGGSIGVEDNPVGKGSSFWATVKKA